VWYVVVYVMMLVCLIFECFGVEMVVVGGDFIVLFDVVVVCDVVML